jgi:hypothetical protein
MRQIADHQQAGRHEGRTNVQEHSKPFTGVER